MDDQQKWENSWDIEISPVTNIALMDIKQLWRYRDLLGMFVKRDIVTVYKQTILGPIWFVLQPLFTTLIFVILFGRIAGLSPDGIPQFAFYLLGITIWSYFSDTLNITSKTFTDNANIFGKVYFPRLIIPLSKVISGFIKFLIQFAFFTIFWTYYVLVTKQMKPDWHIVFAPIELLLLIMMSLGFGILITSLTTKYRDLAFLIAFGLQLLLYATPIAYPLSNPKLHKYELYLHLNPLSSLVEAIRLGFLGKGEFDLFWLTYSFLFTCLILILGIFVFNKVEQKFIDTI